MAVSSITGSAKASPADTADVIGALQFGWMMAEYHGRYSLWSRAVRDTMTGESPLLPLHALPLNDERSPYELAVQIECILCTLAKAAKLDFACGELSVPPSANATPVSEYLENFRQALVPLPGTSPPPAPNGTATWENFFSLLHAWDARIQDALAAHSLNVAGAYQVGRGLAEIWWAGSQDTKTSQGYPWDWLLGTERWTALDLRLGRINQYFNEDVAAAMRASLRAWADVAASPTDRDGPDTMSQLYKQVRIWRDLLLNDYDPDNLLSFDTLIQSFDRVKFRRIAEVFLPEIALTSLGLILLVIGILSWNAWGTAIPRVIAVLGIFGLTTGAVTARAKSTANSLAALLRQTLHRELLAYQITVLPARDRVNEATDEAPGRPARSAGEGWRGIIELFRGG